MAQTIRLLSEQTINQIAAGEVIENPASVIKELIENALDAKAEHIEIEITAGGLQQIIVSDDGIGMSREDAPLSLKNHATSKILEAKDLFHLHTMGFRGEALASIGSISKLTLTTAEQNAIGTKIELEAGEILDIQPHARARGTTIEIRSLFYNVPTRKKFQKDVAQCKAEILRVITLLSLSHPKKSFRFISDQKELLQLPSFSGDSFIPALKMRAKTLLGEEYLKNCFEISWDQNSFQIMGILANPLRSKPNRTGQYLFINQRAVTSSFISETVREAYGTTLANGRFPEFLLHITLPPDLVDANVHPQKKEVRFRDERFLREKIKETVIIAFHKETPQVTTTFFSSFERPIIEPITSLKFQEQSGENTHQELALLQSVQSIGLFQHYLIVEGWSIDSLKDGLCIIDLQAASSRLIFDHLVKKDLKEREKQGLIIPLTVELSSVHTAMILTHLNSIDDLGISLRPIGKNVFIIEAIPPFMDESQIQESLAVMAEELLAFIGKKEIDEQKQRVLASIAARFAKIKTSFSLEESKQIVEKLLKSSDFAYCPKGKKIIKHLSTHEIESFFST